MNIQIHISPKHLVRFFGIAIFIVVSLSVLMTFYHAPEANRTPFVVDLFGRLSVDSEANVPTWYSASALLFSALLLFLIGQHKRQQKDPYARHWKILALVFVWLSIDEAAMMHETLYTPLGIALRGGEEWAFPWLLPAAILVVVFGLWSIRFLLSLPKRTRILFVAAGFTFVLGAAGVELFTGIFQPLYQHIGAIGRGVAHLEELLEMVGIALWIYALADYIAHNIPILNATFGAHNSQQPAQTPAVALTEKPASVTTNPASTSAVKS